MKNILFHMSVIFLLFVMVVMNTGETASARSVYKHKIFSKSVVSKRIDTIYRPCCIERGSNGV